MGRLTVKRRELPRFRVVMIEIRSLLRAWRSATGSYGADRTMKGEFEFAKTSQAPPPPHQPPLSAAPELLCKSLVQS